MAAKKVYFCGSMRGGRGDENLYHFIIQTIASLGAEVLTEFVGWDKTKLQDLFISVNNGGDVLDMLTDQLNLRGLKNDKAIHDQDVTLLRKADAVIAEVTQPSLGVGYEIGRAVAMDKKILCLFRPTSDKNLSAMIRGADNGDTFLVKNYEESQVEEIVKQYVNSL